MWFFLDLFLFLRMFKIQINKIYYGLDSKVPTLLVELVYADELKIYPLSVLLTPYWQQHLFTYINLKLKYYKRFMVFGPEEEI